MAGRLLCPLATALSLSILLCLPSQVAAAVFSVGGSRLEKGVATFKAILAQKVVRQELEISCGPAALSTILQYEYRDAVTEEEVIREILHLTPTLTLQVVRAQGGFSLLDLKRVAERRGYQVTGYVDLTLDELVTFRSPAVLPVTTKGYNHFVVFRGIWGDRVYLADPAFGQGTMKVARFLAVWKHGIALIIQGKGMPSGMLTRIFPSEALFPDAHSVQRSLRYLETTIVGRVP